LKRRDYDLAKQAVTLAQEEIARVGKEIKQLNSQHDKAQKMISSSSLDIKKLQHKLEQLVKGEKDREKKMIDLIKKHPWISAEKASFGVVGGGYDFSAQDINQADARLKELKSNQVTYNFKVFYSYLIY
jgi:hypothetical protein